MRTFIAFLIAIIILLLISRNQDVKKGVAVQPFEGEPCLSTSTNEDRVKFCEEYKKCSSGNGVFAPARINEELVFVCEGGD